MKRRHRTIAFIVVGLAGLAGAAGLVFNALQGNMMFFFSPSQVADKEAPADRAFRLGGLVKVGSVERANDGLTVNFVVTDNHKEIPVIFSGILPDLFKEGTGVVAQGKLSSGGIFEADEVLAKHDEKYMPPEVADALEKGKASAAAAQPSNTAQTAANP
jgi:cytochrome c-type biogenesis protein CcmE